jgi:hypothetical protein
VDPVRNSLQQVFQERPSRLPVRLLDQLGDREFACPINGHEQEELAFAGLHLGNIDVEDPPSQRCCASPAGQGIG